MEFGSSIFGNAIFSPGAAALGAALAGLCGLVVWWLVRKRQTRVWLPTIRIMQLETRVLPRLVLVLLQVFLLLLVLRAAQLRQQSLTVLMHLAFW